MSIVRMLRVTLIGQSKDAEATLAAVQAAGLLHVAPLEQGELTELQVGAGSQFDSAAALEESRRLEVARAAMAALVAEGGSPRAAATDAAAAVSTVLAALQRKDELQTALAAAQATEAMWQPFGEFAPADVTACEAAGVPLRFARVTRNDWQTHGLAERPHEVVRQSDNELWVVFVGPEAVTLPLSTFAAPTLALSQLRGQVHGIQEELREVQAAIAGAAAALPAVDARIAELADRVAVLRVLGQGADAGPLFAVRGYVPSERQADLQRALQPFDAVLLAADPVPGESVPVQLQQPGAIGGFGAVVRAFSGISYWEKDFTPVVMLLFLVFGSLCLLDGGYGLLLLLTGLILRAKGSADFGNVFTVTGVASTLVGVLGGQYFGFLVGKDFWVGQQPPTPLAADAMACFVFSLVVGMLGVTLANATAVWQRGWRTAATGGLLLALGANALAAANFGAKGIAKLFAAAPTEEAVAQLADLIGFGGTALCGAGILAWLVFPDPTFGKGKHAANVAWQLYSGVTGLGQDVMSHMRLFGISLSGAIMAMVVNKIAGMFPLALAIVFGVLAHAMVFVLSLLSLYIHTNRLIFLEFGSKCIDGGQSWYDPLRKGSGSPGAATA